MTTIRIATRGSRQAVTQSQDVADRLAAQGFETELVLIETFGDRTQADNVPLHSIGGLGVFVKEVQRAVLDGRADIAVHSAKDLPSSAADGLVIGAFVERRSAADVLVGSTLAGLPLGAAVATGSVRRRAQLHRVRPDLALRDLRGNIPTRLERIPDGGAIVMALAALEVLGLTDRAAEVLDPHEFVPAVGQGCVAVESRTGDTATRDALVAIDHPPTRRAVTIERAYLAELGSGCSLPAGAHVVDATLYVFLAATDPGSETDTRSAIAVCESVGLSGDLEGDVATAREAARRAHATVTHG